METEEKGGEEHKPRNVGGIWKLEKIGMGSYIEPPEVMQFYWHLNFSKSYIALLPYRYVRQ